MTTVEFLGYDRRGQKVWRVGSGGAIAAHSAKDAKDLWFQGLGSNSLADYLEKYGPLTEEKSK